MKKVISIISWIVLLAAFASLGFSSDDPVVGVPVFGIFFILVFFLVFLYVKNHQKKHAAQPVNVEFLHKIFGLLLLLISLFSPVISLRKISLPFTQNLIIILMTAVLIVLGVVAISLINNARGKNYFLGLLGYLLLIVVASIPAFGATQFLSLYFPNVYNALGTAYWATISVAIFSWWGFSLIQKKA